MWFVISAKNRSDYQIKMGERGQVMLHVWGRGADRFRWGNSAEGTRHSVEENKPDP